MRWQWMAALMAALVLYLSAIPHIVYAQQTKKPNILYIVADDLGWKDVGFRGSDIKTPNIDKLAATGARLEQFYVQPMCTPTRACLMTGRYPFRYGLQTAVIPSSHTYGLPTDEWLLPQALKEAGYSTAIIGKWHLGHADRKYWPRQRGFDYQYGPLIDEIDYFTHEQHGVLDWYRNIAQDPSEKNNVAAENPEKVAALQKRANELAGTMAKPLLLETEFKANAPGSPCRLPFLITTSSSTQSSDASDYKFGETT